MMGLAAADSFQSLGAFELVAVLPAECVVVLEAAGDDAWGEARCAGEGFDPASLGLAALLHRDPAVELLMSRRPLYHYVSGEAEQLEPQQFIVHKLH
ncbi:hypothetical protein [Streptomyces luteogriseus]|uniref:hypothetical protein n=1 Tax=Streptomyces luteogriseus TaxID=68233 RepID=UPI003687DC9A